MFGVGAESFSIGFGREIAGWTDKRGTRWKVGWLPLGGYVKFVGDMNPVSMPGEVDALPPEERRRSFHQRPVWQRFLIVLAGPMANFLLAIVIFAAFFVAFGKPETPAVVGTVAEGSAAAHAGLRAGDRIVSDRRHEHPIFRGHPGRDRRCVPITASRSSFERDEPSAECRYGSAPRQRADEFGQKYVVGLPRHHAVATGLSSACRRSRPFPPRRWRLSTSRA